MLLCTLWHLLNRYDTKGFQMKRFKTLHLPLLLCMAASWGVAGCALDAPTEFGEKCEDIAFIWTMNGLEDVSEQNPDYLLYFDHDICPQEAQFCMTLVPERVGDKIYPEMHYCSDRRESCPENSHLANGNCERDTVNHCGSDRTNCLDRSIGVANAECVDGKNGKECRAKSCLDTYALLNGKCVTGDQCCGMYCHDCFRATPQQVCYTYENKTQCGIGCPNVAPQTCNGVCIDPMSNIAFCGTQNCELHYCLDEVEGWRNGECVVGQCRPSDCLFGYHLASTANGLKYCEPDTPSICGEPHLDCSTAIANSLEVECLFGQCIVKKCRPGFVAYDDKCIRTNELKCGSGTCGPYQRCNAETQTCECQPGYADCNGVCYDLKSNVFHCGSCNYECRMAHASTTCENSQCVYDCDDGYTFNPVSETCEPNGTPIKSCVQNQYDCHGDASLCCDCAGACDAETCDNSVCDPVVSCEDNTGCASSCCIENICVAHGQCSASCASGFHSNGEDCVADDIANCGEVNHPCAVENADNSCVLGVCEFTCKNGYHTHDTGCEQDTIDNCGTHEKKCGVENADNSCNDGACEYICDDGYSDNGKRCCANIDNGTITHDDSETCSFTCDTGYKRDGNICIKATLCELGGYDYYTPDDIEIKEYKVYCLKTADDLTQMATAINAGAHYPDDNTTDTYILANDITADTSTWVPIGNSNYPFKGTLFGNSKTISLNDGSIEVTENYSGFFGYTSEAYVSDLTLHISLTINDEYTPVGGLSGYDDTSTIEHVTADVLISSVKTDNPITIGGLIGDSSSTIIDDVKVTGSLTGMNYVGGICGNKNGGSVKNSDFSGTIEGYTPNRYAGLGGIIGNSESTVIENCTSSGELLNGYSAGGILGTALPSTKINSCHSSMNMHAYPDRQTTDNRYYMGGLIGYIWNNTTRVKDSYATGNLTSDNDQVAIGGFIGQLILSSISNCYASGTLYGFGYVGGFAASLQDNAIVTNCYATGNVFGNKYTGGFVGAIQYNATITSCYATGNVKLNPEHWNGGYYFGGFAGYDQGVAKITNCYASGDVDVSGGNSGTYGVGGFSGEAVDRSIYKNCTAYGNVTGFNKVGGFVGFTSSNNPDGVTFENCSALGYVYASSLKYGACGGFAGNLSGKYSDTISNSYAFSHLNYSAVNESNIGNIGTFIGKIENTVSVSNSYITDDEHALVGTGQENMSEEPLGIQVSTTLGENVIYAIEGEDLATTLNKTSDGWALAKCRIKIGTDADTNEDIVEIFTVPVIPAIIGPNCELL